MIVIASIVAATLSGTFVVSVLKRWGVWVQKRDSDQSKLLSREFVDSSTIMSAEDGINSLRRVRTGKPDFNSLVREAARDVLGSRRRLVVVACGPGTLVQAADSAVGIVRKESSEDDPNGVQIEFFGSESAW